jgi:hypothetical protein
MEKLVSFWIKPIENGFVIEHGPSSISTFCSNKTEVIKKIAEILNLEIGVEIKEKDQK